MTLHAKLAIPKVIMQGKLLQRCTHLLYCSVLSPGGNVNTRRMLPPGMGSIFHMKNHWNILVIGNYYVIIKIIKIKCFHPPRILNEHWCIYSCLHTPPRENWFQYVRKVNAPAINFPCIITLAIPTSHRYPWNPFYDDQKRGRYRNCLIIY